ncbi:hypothetical protein ACLB2K_031572 [Fragaria x ananassa]
MNIHGLGDNEFLVFNYIRGINFNVIMFDKNGMSRCTFMDNQDTEPVTGNVPENFFRRHIVEFVTQIDLVAQDDSVVLVQTCKNNNSVKLGDGWARFRKANRFGAGQVLVMQFVGERTFQVVRQT